jgi:protein-S-isoprenylcysteine O-methyltransferase Ste14
MTAEGTPAYGLWLIAITNAAVFIIFAFSFTHPNTGRDWRSFGAFCAFLVARFTEMYGFPLTIYLLSGWLSSRYPGIDLLAHNEGHLWTTLLGWQGDPHLSPFHLLSYLLIGSGFFLLSSAWDVLYTAQRTHAMATTGPYAYVRHPQYIGFILIMLGFLVQWPTVITLLMFPILVTMYVRLARREEKDSIARYGEQYVDYTTHTPAFFPRLGQIISSHASQEESDLQVR